MLLDFVYFSYEEASVAIYRLKCHFPKTIAGPTFLGCFIMAPYTPTVFHVH